MLKIDLNCDLGETHDGELDRQIMPFISSCNIACGGHFGNAQTMEQAVRLASEHGVAVGAHPSYPDRENFGREEMQLSEEKLRDSLLRQLDAFLSLCEKMGVTCRHVKPHGALYNVAARNESVAKLICEEITTLNDELKLFGLAHSKMESMAQNFGLSFVAEAFADRQYESNKTLMSRKKTGAVLNEQDTLIQAKELVMNQRVQVGTDWLTVRCETLCLHSDTEGAVTLAQLIHCSLVQKGIQISAV